MLRDHHEWLVQAEYDMDTARYMAQGGRFFYAVFMCHLSIEKALKGLYQFHKQALPEKTHNLVFLLNQIPEKPSEELGRFIVTLNSASVATRYPESLKLISANFTTEKTADIIARSQEVLAWIKQKY